MSRASSRWAKACELAGQYLGHEGTEVRAMRDTFEEGILDRISGAQVNGDRVHRLPNTSNLAFEGIDSEAVLMLLDQAGICCSSGSACTTGSVHASHVLKAMGFSDERARSSLRFSFRPLQLRETKSPSARHCRRGCRQAASDCGGSLRRAAQ
jgi:cysteine desulfurase